MMMTAVGIDLAKNGFSMHGIDEHGKAVPRRCWEFLSCPVL